MLNTFIIIKIKPQTNENEIVIEKNHNIKQTDGQTYKQRVKYQNKQVFFNKFQILPI